MKIETDVIEILEQCRIEENRLFLPDIQLDRKLYVKVNKVLNLAGGTWTRGVKSHVFHEDVGDRLDTLILTGEIVDTNKELQFFETPPAVVEQLFELAELKPDDRILEPSAGKGAIAFAIIDKGFMPIAYEIHEPFVEILSARLACVCWCNFLEGTGGTKFDKVIANPPFTRQQDIDHVEKMIDVCSGRVVSVMCASVMWRDNKKAKMFRELIDQMGGEFIELPEGSFKESGTMVNTCLVVVDC